MITNNYRAIILDASALIAFLSEEIGAEIVKKLLSNAVMSCVNIAEVAKFLVDNKNIDNVKARELIEHLISESFVFDNDQAFKTAELISYTKKYGLSIADRACLALSLRTGYPIYTADKVWKKLKIDNIDINLIR